MNIPLLNKEDVEKEDIEKEDIEKEDIEKEDIDVCEEEKDIREQIVEFLKSKGYKHLPDGNAFIGNASDLFANDEQLIQVIINDEIPDEILEQMKGVEQ